MASFSDGTFYINELLITSGAFNSDFQQLLSQVWNFADATDLSKGRDNRLNPLIAQTVTTITYFDPNADTSQGSQVDQKPGQIKFELPSSSWANYAAALTKLQTDGVPIETPPLPGQDPTIPEFTHYQVRDFTFLDAAVRRVFGSSNGVAPSSDVITFNGITCEIRRIDLGAVVAVADGSQPRVSLGTNLHDTSNKLLVDTGSVAQSNSVLTFSEQNVEITLRLYELWDVSTGDATNAKPAAVVPNWFGAAVPTGLTDFSRPILYFHPTPSQNHYNDGVNNAIYLAKTNVGPSTSTTDNNGNVNNRDWRELFAYLDRLGNQLAGARLEGANLNQVVIMPFMTTSSASDGSAGLLKENWLAVITAILQDLSNG